MNQFLPWRAPARSLVAVLALVAAVGGGGCTFSSLTSARTIDPGEAQFGVAGQGLRINKAGNPLTTPSVEIAGRYGVTPNVEVGMRAFIPGVFADAKVQLKRSATPDSGIDIAVDPAVGYLRIPDSNAAEEATLHIVSLSLPVLIGFNVGRGNSVVLAPRIVEEMWLGESTVNRVSVGTALGFIWKVTDSVRIMPEVSVGAQVFASLSEAGKDVGLGGNEARFSVAFLFGGYSPPRPEPCRCPAPHVPAAEGVTPAVP